MPKGVEHVFQNWADFPLRQQVNTYEMPKGVEHCAATADTPMLPATSEYYEMPKGVEHSYCATADIVFSQ